MVHSFLPLKKFLHGKQVLHRFFFFLQKGNIKSRAVPFPGDFQSLGKKFLRLFHLFSEFSFYSSHPGGIFQLLLAFYLVSSAALLQPFPGIGITHGKLIELQYQVFNILIGFSLGKSFYKGRKLLIVFPSIGFFQDLFRYVPFHQPHFPFISHTERRVQVNKMKIVFYHIGAEAVYGGDLSMVDQGALPLKVFVFAVFLQPFLNGSGNPLFHLSCRSFGKSHHQQPVNIHRPVFIHDPLQDPLYQHRSFSASCRGAYQNVAVPGIYDLLLFFGP